MTVLYYWPDRGEQVTDAREWKSRYTDRNLIVEEICMVDHPRSDYWDSAVLALIGEDGVEHRYNIEVELVPQFNATEVT